jgi:hypothetical protein
VSKRSKRREGPHRGDGEGAAETARAREAASGGARGRPAAEGPARQVDSGWSLGVQLALLFAVFVAAVVVAELSGAANLGVALGVGQIAFAIVVIYLLVRR